MAEMGERVATLEVKVQDLHGNGQPGRMEKAERRIGKLEKIGYMVLGACGLIEMLHTLRDIGVLPR